MAVQHVTTIDSSGAPHTSTINTSSGKAAPAAAITNNKTSSSGIAPGQPGWVDPIRGPKDTTVQNMSADQSDGTAPVVPAGAPIQPQNTNSGQQAGAVSYEQAKANLASGGLAGGALAGAQDSLASAYNQTPPSKYQAALSTLQSSGTPAAQDAGQARSQVSAAVPSVPDTSAVDNYVSQDPGVADLFKNITDLLKPENQTSSLMDDYQSLYKQSGLGDINKELIDAETVINGTEDDIRNEIQTAGGFGTESQVQALSLARNKGLLTRYNQLVQMQTNAQNQLNTMTSLDSQDKQMAQTRLNTQISTMFNLANFQQQAQSNTREAFNAIVSKVGYAGAYAAYATDPKQLSMIESTMGLEPGGLQSLAAQPDLDQELKVAQINSANRANGGSGSGASDPATVSAWAQNIRSGTAKLSDITGSPALKSAVSLALAQGGSSQTDILNTTASSLQELQTMIDNNHGFKGIGGAVGLGAALTGGGSIPGSSGADFLAKFNQVKNDVVLPNLTLLHGLGRVTDREFQALTSAVTSLSPKESPEQFQTDLNTVTSAIYEKQKGLSQQGSDQVPTLLTPDQVPDGYYQASDGLLYKK